VSAKIFSHLVADYEFGMGIMNGALKEHGFPSQLWVN
jgi:hypothetical protein